MTFIAIALQYLNLKARRSKIAAAKFYLPLKFCYVKF